MALKKAFRVVQKKEFRRIARTGKTVRSSFLFIRWVPNEVKRNRFGFLVSAGVSPKAVVRNALKRLFTECARRYAGTVSQGRDVVIAARPGIVRVPRAAIREELGELLRRVDQTS